MPAFCIGLVALMWVGLAYQTAYERDAQIEHREVEHDNLARLYEEHVLGVLASASVTLRDVEIEYRKQGARLDLAKYLHDRPELQSYRNITVINGDGYMVLNSVPFTKPLSVRESENFQYHLNNTDLGLFVSKPRFGKATGKWTIYITRRMNRSDGSFGGNTTIGIDPAYFSRFYDQISLGRDSVVTLVGRDGIVRARRSNENADVGQDLRQFPQFTSHSPALEAGHEMSTNAIDGVARLYSYRSVKGFPLVVAVGSAVDVTLAGVERRAGAYRWWAAGISILILGFAALVTLQGYRRRRYEQALRNRDVALQSSEERLQRAQRLAHIGNWEWNIQTDDLHWERENYRIFGLPPETIPSVETFLGTVHSDDLELVKRSLTDALEGHKPYDLDMRIRRPDGTERVVHTYGEIDRDGDGKPVRFFGTVQDITERKRAEDALRESETRYRALAETAADAIITADSEGRIIGWNRAAECMFGHTQEQILGQALTSIMPERYRDAHTRGLRTATAREVARRAAQLCGLTQDGREIPIELSLSSWSTAKGAFFTAVVRDITERRRLEEAHVQAQKLESLGTLAGGIAHDFNNILAAIRGNVDLAVQDVGPDHMAMESLAEIRKASTRAGELVRRIMAFGRPKDTQRIVTDLSAVVGEVLKLLRSTLPARILLKKEFAQGTPHVLADAGQIHEAVVNLTTNAAYAIGPRAGSIEYRLEPVQVGEMLARSIPGIKEGRYARLTVTDSGCGMDAATLERIFDAFYTTKPVGEGTGLGLSMVHGTMRSHGGAVTVESAPGEGSSFALYFSAVKEQAVKEEDSAAAQSLPSVGQRVLYVDDEEALVFLARRVLSRLGHTISGFTDPNEALAAFRMQPQDYDIVVTDLSMPHMSGFDLAREVLVLRPNMPVLMTTGYISAEDERSAHAAGIRELILKPVTVDELGRMLDRLFRDSLARS